MVRVLAVIMLLWVVGEQPAPATLAFPLPTGCTHAGKGARLSSRPVVAFGDGVTWGVNATRNCARSTTAARPLAAHIPGPSDTTYPAQLGRLLHRTVLDYGVRGEGTGAGLKRIAAVLAAAQPSSVLVFEGYTDLLRGDTPALIADRIILIAQLIQSYGAQPILLTLYPPRASGPGAAPVRQLDTFIRNQGAERGFRVIDLSTVFRGKAGVLSQGLYPNDSGYRVLAAAVVAGLRRSITWAAGSQGES